MKIVIPQLPVDNLILTVDKSQNSLLNTEDFPESINFGHVL